MESHSSSSPKNGGEGEQKGQTTAPPPRPSPPPLLEDSHLIEHLLSALPTDGSPVYLSQLGSLFSQRVGRTFREASGHRLELWLSRFPQEFSQHKQGLVISVQRGPRWTSPAAATRTPSPTPTIQPPSSSSAGVVPQLTTPPARKKKGKAPAAPITPADTRLCSSDLSLDP